MNYGWCNMCYIFCFNCCCSRNRDSDKCYARAAKGLILIGNSPLG